MKLATKEYKNLLSKQKAYNSKMTELNSACSAYIHGYILSTSHLVAYVLDKMLNKFFPLNVY